MTPEKIVQGRKFQSPAYENPGVRYLGAATSIVWLAEERLQTSIAAIPIGNANRAEMSSGRQAHPVRCANTATAT